MVDGMPAVGYVNWHLSVLALSSRFDGRCGAGHATGPMDGYTFSTRSVESF